MPKVPTANDIFSSIINDTNADISRNKEANAEKVIPSDVKDFCSKLRKTAAEMPVTLGQPATEPIKDGDIKKLNEKPTDPPVVQKKEEDAESVPAKDDVISNKTDPPEGKIAMGSIECYKEFSKIAANEWISTKSNGTKYTFRNSPESHKIMQMKNINESGKIKLLMKNNLMKKVANSAMEELMELCDGAVKGHEHLKVAAGFGAAIRKVLPFLWTAAVGAGGTALAMDDADKKEDPKIYNLGLRRGYMAGADAMAEAITQSMGNGQQAGIPNKVNGGV